MITNYFDAIDCMFLTITIIMAVTYAVYAIGLKFNRPLVLSGLIAGIIINNSHLPQKYFNIHSCGGLGDVGIVLFMMLLGSQFQFKALFQHKRDSLISLISISLPLMIGFFFAPLLVKYDLASPVTQSTMTIFSIFIGIAVSMTAFPLLSLFIGHTNLINSKIGNLAVLCGSVDEVVFWILLGSVLILSQKSAILGSFALHGAILYGIFMVFIAPRLIKFICSKISSARNMLGFMLIGCFLSAVLADMVNLHEIFGAFLFGLLLPSDNQYVQRSREQISEFITLMLLPIYFVKSGMLANFHVILNEKIIILSILITLIAIVGKFSGAFITGRILGYSRNESMLLGSLLNMRGIIEVVILNIGLELNIISESVYSMFIIMTIVSNFFATAVSLHVNKKISKDCSLDNKHQHHN